MHLPRQKFNRVRTCCHVEYNRIIFMISKTRLRAQSTQGRITIKRGKGISSSRLQKAPYEIHKSLIISSCTKMNRFVWWESLFVFSLPEDFSIRNHWYGYKATIKQIKDMILQERINVERTKISIDKDSSSINSHWNCHLMIHNDE